MPLRPLQRLFLADVGNRADARIGVQLRDQPFDAALVLVGEVSMNDGRVGELAFECGTRCIREHADDAAQCEHQRHRGQRRGEAAEVAPPARDRVGE
jgi:hypothetical protein